MYTYTHILIHVFNLHVPAGPCVADIQSITNSFCKFFPVSSCVDKSLSDLKVNVEDACCCIKIRCPLAIYKVEW